jgi:broad specificity phosphatase PhoE
MNTTSPQRRSMHRLIVFAFTALFLSGCASQTKTVNELTVIVVRHAEKQTAENTGTDFDAKDPLLTQQGSARAAALAGLLKSYPVVAVYATPFKRTQATAAPTATAFGVAIQSYEATESAAAFAERLRAKHQTGAVLVVGHSNTVPAIVAALCSCTAPVLTDSDYGDRFEITIDSSGAAEFKQAEF